MVVSVIISLICCQIFVSVCADTYLLTEDLCNGTYPTSQELIHCIRYDFFNKLRRSNNYNAFVKSAMSYSLCGPETEVALEAFGKESSAVIELLPNRRRSGQCKLKVTAPDTHVINIQWMDDDEELRGSLLENQSEPYIPCFLNVFLPENKRVAVWKGDPCSDESLQEIDLLPPQLKLVWSPPRVQNFTVGRKLVVTAVGKGDICTTPGFHACMRIGFDPILCVSEQLVCDGYKNCPNGAPTGDEDEKICKKSQRNWKQIAVEIFKKLKPPAGLLTNKWLHDKIEDAETTLEPDVIDWKDIQMEITTKPSEDQKHETDSVSAALSHYGPWGYLMLGMLICGTVLMFCGLWECCFRRPKPSNDATTSRQQPTTVLILNPQQNEATTVQQPPNYDELDEPPSYSVLFPNNKLQYVDGQVVICNESGETSHRNSTVSRGSGDAGNVDGNERVGESSDHSVADSVRTDERVGESSDHSVADSVRTDVEPSSSSAVESESQNVISGNSSSSDV